MQPPQFRELTWEMSHPSCFSIYALICIPCLVFSLQDTGNMRRTCILILFSLSFIFGAGEICENEPTVDKGCYCYWRDAQFLTISCSNVTYREALAELKKYQNLTVDYLDMKAFSNIDTECLLDFFKDITVLNLVFRESSLNDERPCKAAKNATRSVSLIDMDTLPLTRFSWRFLSALPEQETLNVININAEGKAVTDLSRNKGMKLKHVHLNAANIGWKINSLNLPRTPTDDLTTVIVTADRISELVNAADDFGKHAETIEVLDLSLNEIEKVSTDYFETFANLRTLYLGSNSISAISIPKGLIKLKNLQLDNNILSSLSLPRNVWRNLEKLTLSGNKLICGPHLEFIFNAALTVDSDCNSKLIDHATCNKPRGGSKKICDLTYDDVYTNQSIYKKG